MTKKNQSRFKFAHSVVHHSTGAQQDEDDEIIVPKPIQDLIARSIRTPSHSLSVKSKTTKTNHDEKQEDSDASDIQKLNKLLEEEGKQQSLSDIKELKEKWQ